MTMPKPFRRPSIDLSSGQRRVWDHVAVEDLEVGDTVAAFGTVFSKQEMDRGILLTNPDGEKSGPHPPHRTLYAFSVPT